jgi:hypothetical protein
LLVLTLRLEALIFGSGDLAASQGVGLDKPDVRPEDFGVGHLWYYARSRIVVAARSAAIDAVDGPYAFVRDPTGYRREAVRSRREGFVGKWAIHPSQIDIANSVYSPGEEALSEARRLIAGYEEAESEWAGVVEVDGRMIDGATVRGLREVVGLGNLIWVLPGSAWVAEAPQAFGGVERRGTSTPGRPPMAQVGIPKRPPRGGNPLHRRDAGLWPARAPPTCATGRAGDM